MGSLGKQGEAAGEVGGGQLAVLEAHPQAAGCSLGSPAGASRLSPCTHWSATCDAPITVMRLHHSAPLAAPPRASLDFGVA